MKKNIVTLLSVFALSTAVLAGCGEKAVEETAVEATTEATEAEVEAEEAATEETTEEVEKQEELKEVLLGLGYKEKEIKAILPQVDSTLTIEEQVKYALKLFLK